MGANDKGSELAIHLACRFSNGNYVIVIDGKDIPLTLNLFQALAELIAARLRSHSGLTHMPSLPCDRNTRHQLVHRLRKATSAVLGKGTGARLIKHGVKSSYYLDTPRSAITICPSIIELADEHLPAKLIDDLLAGGKEG